MAKVAILGTGIIGTGMAHSLRRAGHDVVVWNRTIERARAVGEGAEVAESPALAVESADVVITALPDAPITSEVAIQFLPSMAGGDTVWVQSATVGLEGSRQLSSLAADAEIPYVEAPVSGTKQPAEDGQLIMLAAAAQDVRSKTTDVFDAVGAKTVWVGTEPAQAQAMKLVANNWVTSLTASLAETLTLADSLGLEAGDFLSAIQGGPLDSGYVQSKGALMQSGEFPTSFSTDLALKDTRLISDAAREGAVDMPVATAVGELYQRASKGGWGDHDMSAVVQVVRSSEK